MKTQAKAKISMQKLFDSFQIFRWQDYGYFALTAYLGSLTASGKGWLVFACFLVSLYFSAEKIYRVSRRKDKDGFEYYYQKAYKSFAANNFIEAASQISKGLRLGSRLTNSPYLYSGYILRAHSCLMLNDHEAAIKACTSAIKVDPSQSRAYYLRGLAKSQAMSNVEDCELDLRKAADLGDQDAVEMLSRVSSRQSEGALLEPAENLAEWRISQAILARNAAYILAYERYIERLDESAVIEEFHQIKNQLYAEYVQQLEIAAKYKDAYMLFRLRNLTYAYMAVNMHGQSLEEEEVFAEHFLHPLFDETDTRLRKILSEEEIQEQIKRANDVDRYIMYGCSIYCNKLLNLIDGGRRKERDIGENFTAFLEIQTSLEQLKKFDDIYVVREAMLWTIASTNVDLVTSAEDSDAFEVKALKLLSKTNHYKSDYGNGPYRKDDIIKAIVQRYEWGSHLGLITESVSSAEYQEKLLEMADDKISMEAIGKDSPRDMRQFLNRWGQTSNVEYGIDDLRQSVINDYAYLCYQDGGTQPDETSLEEYKKNVEIMSVEELISETSVIETSELKIDELIDYMELWLKYSEYADYSYERTSEGGQQLVDKIMKRSIELAQQPNVFAVISYNEDIDYEILGEFTTETDAKSFFEKTKKSPPSDSRSLEICIMNNGYFVLDEDEDEGVIERFEIPDDL